MRVKVRYLGLMRSLTNQGEEEFDFKEGSLLVELLNRLAAKYGEKFKTEVYEQNAKDLKTGFVALINGILMGQLRGVETPLKNGDHVILMPLMTGG